MEDNKEDFIQRHLISQPIPPNSGHVTLKNERFERIKGLNKELENLIQDQSLEEINSINKKNAENKARIMKMKRKTPSEEEIHELKKEQENQNKHIEKIEEFKKGINDSKIDLEKCDQIKVFFSVLIEKALDVYYPKIAERDIHKTIIQSVEEDKDFDFGNELLQKIGKKT